MPNTKQWVDPDGQIANTGTRTTGVYLVDPTTLLAYAATGGGGGGGAVTVADGADVALGTTTDAAGANTVVGQLKAINADTADIETNTANIPPLGQATMAASTPVAIASNQSNVPVTANAGTNLNTSALALDATMQSILTDTNDIEASVANIPPLGAATIANSTPVNIASNQTVPVSGTITTTPPSNASTNLTQVGGAAIAEGQTTMANSLPVAVASDNGLATAANQTTGNSSLTSLVTNTGNIPAKGSATMAASTPVTMASDDTLTTAIKNSVANIPAKGTNTMANSSPVTIATDDTQMTAIKNSVAVIPAKGAATTANSMPVNIASDQILPVKLQANSGQVGTSDYHLISAATTNANSIKASSGQVYGYEISNTGAGFAYVKLFNKASAPTVGTDTPIRTIGVPPASSVRFHSSTGLKYGTGIAVAITGGIADNDTTAVLLSQVSLDVDYL